MTAGQPASSIWTARTRECQPGAVFTQTTLDPDAPIRARDCTSYVGTVETAHEFGYRIYIEAWCRGWEWATTKIVTGDGAVWIRNLADQHFPGAVQIVDFYPARQHLWDLAALRNTVTGDEFLRSLRSTNQEQVT